MAAVAAPISMPHGCRERGCLEPIVGIARLRRHARPTERSYPGFVWGGWEYYCAEHIEEAATSGDYLVSRDSDRTTLVPSERT